MTRIYGLLVFLFLIFSVESKFRWRHCKGQETSDVISIKSLKISPNPIRLPGTILVEFNVHLYDNLTEPLSIKADVWKVKRRRFTTMRTKLPRALTKLDNLCAEISTDEPCPAYLTDNHIECTCPPTPGMFNTSVTPVTFTVAKIPSIVAMFASGTFEARIKLTDGPGERLLVCLEVDARIQAKSKG